MSVQKSQPLVSIIILNFNGKNCLMKCLSSCLRTKYPNFEVILVDNASTDCSLNLAEETFRSDERLRIIRNTKNLSYSAGNNVGFKNARGSLIAFLNNDTVVVPCWLTPLVDVMEKDQTVGLAQSIILEYNGEEIQTAGDLYSDFLQFWNPLGKGKPNGTEFPPVFEISVAVGAAMIIRRKLVDEIGLFDPQAPFYYDDTLLSLKTWLAGKRVVTVSESKVCHMGGESMEKGGATAQFNVVRAYVCLMFDLYPRLNDLIEALFAFAFYQLIPSVLFFIRNKRLQNFYSVTRALVWVLRTFPYIRKNQLEHWSKARITPEILITKFIRMKLPTSLYLLPYRLRKKYYVNAAKKYENMLRGMSANGSLACIP